MRDEFDNQRRYGHGWKGFALLVGLVTIGAGIAACGWFVQQGLYNFHNNDRSVEVKGLSERYVKADIADWTLSHSVQAEKLADAQVQLAHNEAAARQFFQQAGFKPEEISVGDVSVVPQIQSETGATTGYEIDQTFLVRTTDVDKVAQAVQKLSDLITAGVVVKMSTPHYIFTKINDIKPDMIADATKNAREAAKRFAQDSGAQVGPITSAEQGEFEVQARDGDDETKAIDKLARVVTTVNFRLDDNDQ